MGLIRDLAGDWFELIADIQPPINYCAISKNPGGDRPAPAPLLRRISGPESPIEPSLSRISWRLSPTSSVVNEWNQLSSSASHSLLFSCLNNICRYSRRIDGSKCSESIDIHQYNSTLQRCHRLSIMKQFCCAETLQVWCNRIARRSSPPSPLSLFLTFFLSFFLFSFYVPFDFPSSVFLFLFCVCVCVCVCVLFYCVSFSLDS